MSKLNLEPVCLCLFIRDTEKRRQIETRLRTEPHAFQNVRDGIVITDEEARIEHANPAFATLWGYGHSEALKGRDLRLMLAPISSEAPPEQQPLLWWSLLVDHESWLEELLGIRKDGATFQVLANAACNRDREARVIGTVLSFTDITDRKRAEEALRQAEHQRVMLASVGAACHPLGQPMPVLSADLELIKRLVAGADRAGLSGAFEASRTAIEQISKILLPLPG